MKAFRFRLEQVLRWRETQVGVQKSRTAMAAAKLSELQAALAGLRREAQENATAIANSQSGVLMSQYAHFAARSRRKIDAVSARVREAERALDAEKALLVKAERDRKLLEQVRAARAAEWQAGFERELEAFAGESFLGRIQSKKTPRTFS